MDATREAGTKFVATIGPATSTVEAVERLLRAGADVIRLNFSHGRRADHEQAVQAIRTAAERLRLPIPIMGDLCGPKTRLLEIEGGSFEIAPGDTLRIVREPVAGNAERVAVNHPRICEEVEVGHRVLIDDGAVRLRVVAQEDGALVCTCEVGGTLSSRKGLNLPDSDLSVATLTGKDLDDVAWAAEAGVEYIALSFVRCANDIRQLRERLAAMKADCHVLAKIETRRAIDNLDAIIDASDAVLIARGDLGVEVDLATVPRLQKDITERCRRAGKPVVVATQMLQSMVSSPTPTRAEVNDVANAIYDGADALLLSAETAVGKYPVEAIAMLERIALETESHDEPRALSVTTGSDGLEVAAAVASSICTIANATDAKAVVVWTETGTLARLVSKHRLDRPAVALTPCPVVQRRLSLYYGVIPIRTAKPARWDDLIALADRTLLAGEWVAAGDLVVVGFGPRSLAHGETGSIILHKVERR